MTATPIITNMPEELQQDARARALAGRQPSWPPNLRRAQASEYLLQNYGIVLRPSTLAKWFCMKSDGPPAHVAGRIPLYPRDALDTWATKRLGPLRGSTSDAKAA